MAKSSHNRSKHKNSRSHNPVFWVQRSYHNPFNLCKTTTFRR